MVVLGGGVWYGGIVWWSVVVLVCNGGLWWVVVVLCGGVGLWSGVWCGGVWQ